MPSLITMAIAATRMYRSLADFCSTDVYGNLPLEFISVLTQYGWSLHSVESENQPRIGHVDPYFTSTFTASIPPRRIGVEVDRAHEKYPPSLRDENVPYTSGDHLVQLRCDKPDDHSAAVTE